MNAPDWVGAEAFALERLARGLSPHLTYHSLAHTRDEVLPAALRLAALEGLGEHDTRLLRVAAAYHDLGFTVRGEEHERAGVDLVREHLPGFGFVGSDVQRVAGLILATRQPQAPRTLAEQILADADLDVLGREDFLIRNAALRAEQAALGSAVSDAEWYGVQHAFLQDHVYFTASARALRDESRRHNAGALRELLASCTEN